MCAWVGQVDDLGKEANRKALAQEDALIAAGLLKKQFIRSYDDTGPRDGYTWRDGEKGRGYYDTKLARKSKSQAEELLYSCNCADGTLEGLNYQDMMYLSTSNLPAVALPKDTVRQIIDAAHAATAAATEGALQMPSIAEKAEDEEEEAAAGQKSDVVQ